MNAYALNFSLLTDRKIYINFPHLTLNISDSTYSLIDLCNLLSYVNFSNPIEEIHL